MKKKAFIHSDGILLVLICALGYTIYNAVFAGKESISEGWKRTEFCPRGYEWETYRAQ